MKNKFFLLVTLAVIANTQVKGMQVDPEFNVFAESVNRGLTPQEKAVSSKLATNAVETFQSARAWFERQLGIQSVVDAVVTDSPIVSTTPVVKTVTPAVEQPIIAEPITPIVPVAQPAIPEPVIEKINRIEQFKTAYLKPFAIVSFVCCVGLIAYKTYQYTHEIDENMAEDKPVTEVN